MKKLDQPNIQLLPNAGPAGRLQSGPAGRLARGVPPSLIPGPLRVNTIAGRCIARSQKTDWLDLTRPGAEMNWIEIQFCFGILCWSECSQQVLQSHLINLLREILETYLMPDKQGRCYTITVVSTGRTNWFQPRDRPAGIESHKSHLRIFVRISFTDRVDKT